MGEPRVWTLPGQPGLEVKAVRDGDGELWIRTEDGWVVDPPSGYPQAWNAVMMFAPLRDATTEIDDDEAEATDD